MRDIFKKQDVLLPGVFCYDSQKVAIFLPILPPAVTWDYRAELSPVTLTVLKLKSDSYIYDRMICHSSVYFATVMFTTSDRKNGLPYLNSAFYVANL
jgi:hypothetical protein